MQVFNVDQNSDEWLELRRGKITGSKLSGIIPKKRGDGKKIGFYELMAERLAIEEGAEDPMERGHRLEAEAIAAFEASSGKKVERVGFCVSDLHPSIALSPDGLIAVDGKWKEGVEVKCLSAARHLEAWDLQKVPADYEEQVLQYFIVDEALETLYFVFYDPRIAAKPLFTLEVHRAEVEGKLQEYLSYQIAALEEVDALLEKLLF